MCGFSAESAASAQRVPNLVAIAPRFGEDECAAERLGERQSVPNRHSTKLVLFKVARDGGDVRVWVRADGAVAIKLYLRSFRGDS